MSIIYKLKSLEDTQVRPAACVQTNTPQSCGCTHHCICLHFCRGTGTCMPVASSASAWLASPFNSTLASHPPTYYLQLYLLAFALTSLGAAAGASALLMSRLGRCLGLRLMYCLAALPGVVVAQVGIKQA